MIFIWSYQKLTKQLRQTFFYNHIHFIFTLLVNCINTTVLAEQSLHHNIILDRLDHSSVSRICTKSLISYSHTTSLSYTKRQNESMFLLIRFFQSAISFSSFLHSHIKYEVEQVYLLIRFYHSAISFTFFFSSFPYKIWSWASLLADSFLSFSWNYFSSFLLLLLLLLDFFYSISIYVKLFLSIL